MVTLTKYGAKYNRNILFLEGLSTDTKPTDEFDGLSIQNGSEYTEVDTGKKFLFDYDNATWYEVQTGGGGGGGGGTSNYNDLSNRPSVNNTVLTGNKTSAQLGLASSEQGGKADSAIQGVKLNGGSVITPDANNIVDISVPITAIQKNGTGITPVSGTVNITVPTTAADVSALPDTTKYAAALSLTINSSTFVMTGQLKDQNGDNLGTAQTIDLPLESVVVGGSYNSQTKKVVLTLQNGNTIEFSVADLVSGLQTELSASNKLNPAYIDYDSTHRAVSDTEKSTWSGKQDALSSSQLSAVNSGIDSTKVAQIATNENNISLIKQVPTVSSGDNGKVLTAGSSSYSWTTPTITGVKGGQESTYRTGNVSISAANILSTAQQNAVNSGVTSSTVSQVATNTSNIAWTKTTLQFSAIAADTYEYTGLSVACPANTLLEIWAIDDNSNARITAIAVTDSATSIDAVGAVIGENAEPLSMDAGAQWAREVHCVTPRLYGSVRTYYVWVKRGSTGANNVTLLTRKIVTQ